MYIKLFWAREHNYNIIIIFLAASFNVLMLIQSIWNSNKKNDNN